MSFLPDDYKVPTETKYMRFKEGDNRFRILSESPAMGWEYWTEEDGKQKPNREKDMTDILIKTFSFLQYYNNNYRPIYHLESYIFYLSKKVHGFS